MSAKLGDKYSPWKTGLANKAATTLTVGAEASDAIIVTGQLKDANGRVLAERVSLRAWLASDSAGSTHVGTAPSGAVAISGGAGVLNTLVTKKEFNLVTNATGGFAITITESGVYTCYLALQMPDGSIKVSGAITFA